MTKEQALLIIALYKSHGSNKPSFDRVVTAMRVLAGSGLGAR
jgi:hypothetical protein